MDYFYDFGDILNAFFSGVHSREENAKRCPICNRSFDEIRKTSRLGCSECYNTFRDELEESISKIHGGKRHVFSDDFDKITEDNTSDAHDNSAQKIKILENEMRCAVSEENYEKAAQLRDEIKKLGGDKNDLV